MPVIGIGADQSKWAFAAPTDSTAALLAEGEYAYKTILNGNNPTAGYNLLTLAESNTLALMFYGKNADGLIATARIWGLSAVPTGGITPDNFIGTYLGTVSIVLGNTEASTGLFNDGVSAFRFAEQANPTDDKTNTPPGMRLVGDAPLGSAVLLFDTIGYSRVIVQLTNITNDVPGTATTKVGLLWRAF